jgi:hypothetical protein
MGMMSMLLGAGGSSAFTPSSITGLRTWLKADGLSLSDNDNVTSWADASGNSNNYSGSSVFPVFKTNIINGKPVVRFNGTQAQFTGPGNFLSANPYTLLAVFSCASFSSYRALFSVYTSDTDGMELFTFPSGNVYGGNWDGQTSFGGLSANTFYAVSLTSNGSATQLYNANSAVGTPGITRFSTFSAVPRLGSRNGNFIFSGDIAELLIYNSALGSTDRASLQSYFTSKYGI